jgi:outer membrane protein assembly factor BamB
MKFVRNTLLAVVGAVLLIGHTFVFGYTSMSVAVDSNLLAYEGKLLFAQGTGSLTRLELSSGKVLDRVAPPKDASFGGRLYRNRHGIFMADYRLCALLDERTLEALWCVGDTYDAAPGDEYFVSHNGYDAVSCFAVENGEKIWTLTIQGGWSLLALGNLAVVSTPAGYEKGDLVVVVDMPTGNELFRLKAAPEEIYLTVYLEADAVHVLTAKKDPDVLSWDAVPVELRTYDLSGEERSRIDMTSDDITWQWGYKTGRHGFLVGDRYFDGNGHVRATYDHEPDSWKKSPDNGESLTISLPAGMVTECSIQDAVDEEGTLLSFAGPDATWSSYLSHLGEDGRVGQMIQTDGKLVVASGQGHVECIDLESGEPEWMYVFPTIRRTMSFSRYSMPPTLTQQAAKYRTSLKNLSATAGTISLGTDTELKSLVFRDLRKQQSYAGRINVDPAPDDPFGGLIARLTVKAVSLAIAPLLVVASLGTVLKRKHRQAGGTGLSAWDCRLLSGISLLMLLSPLLAVLLYGRVDRTLTYLLWGMVVLCVIASFVLGRTARLKDKL